MFDVGSRQKLTDIDCKRTITKRTATALVCQQCWVVYIAMSLNHTIRAARGYVSSRLCFSLPAPRIEGECELVSSTTRSLTFRWSPAMSASSYRFVRDSINRSYISTEYHATVYGLTPGSFYSFTVTAIGAQGLESNSISCINSTSQFQNFMLKNNSNSIIEKRL